MEKVSIIVPVYNGEKSLPRCVDSILRQDYENLEVILVNDGSKDDSARIIDEYAAADSRVIAVHKENGGVSSTRNRGLSIASGEYVQFIDVDDYLPMDSTKQLVRGMSEESDLVVGDFYRVTDDLVSKKGSIDRSAVMTRNSYAQAMLQSPADFYYGVLWNKLYRREILQKHQIRMKEDISFSEDMIFNLEYLLHVRNVSVIKVPVYYYIRTKGSLVDQNLDVEHIVKMKTTVINYYNDFYRQILDEKQYLASLPMIYGYLLAVGTDNFSMSLNTRKLGEESGEKIYLNSIPENTELMNQYLNNALISRYLYALGQKENLTVNEMRILLFLYQSRKPCAIEEISQYTGLSQLSVATDLVRLMAGGLVRLKKLSIKESLRDNYEYCGEQLTEELELLISDYDNVCFEGISEEDISKYNEVRDRISENIRKRLL